MFTDIILTVNCVLETFTGVKSVPASLKTVLAVLLAIVGARGDHGAQVCNGGLANLPQGSPGAD